MSTLRQLVYRVFKNLAKKEMDSLEADCRAPEAAQLRMFRQIMQLNGRSQFARDHGLTPDSTLEEFRKAVPISDYEAHRPYVDRIWNGEANVLSSEQPFMYATTSGTMGKAKYIPVTKSYIKEFRHASVASGYFMLQNYPKIANGVTLTVFSPAEEGLSPAGVPYGAISGGLYLREPWLVKKVIAPIPYDVYLCRDYESKYYSILRCALVLPIATFYTLNPSTVVVLMKRLHQYADRLIEDIAEGKFSPPEPASENLKKAMQPFLRKDPQRARYLAELLQKGEFQAHKIWPELQVVCCWTRASAAFYIKDFPEYFGDVPVCDISYGASEGRGTISMGDGRQLLSIRSHFFEFIPEEQIEDSNPEVLLAHQLEVGENYYIIFTTSAGLYRYHINDVVKVTGKYHQCPLLEFQYKGGNISSFTGEKITELQVTDAMRAALSSSGNSCRFFTLIPEFRPNPHYKLLIEPESGMTLAEPQLQKILTAFESELCALNIEYQTKRESQRLDPPEAVLIQNGAYENMRKSLAKSGVADAQIKISHLNPKTEVREFFEAQVEPGTLIVNTRPFV